MQHYTAVVLVDFFFVLDLSGGLDPVEIFVLGFLELHPVVQLEEIVHYPHQVNQGQQWEQPEVSNWLKVNDGEKRFSQHMSASSIGEDEKDHHQEGDNEVLVSFNIESHY